MAASADLGGDLALDAGRIGWALSAAALGMIPGVLVLSIDWPTGVLVAVVVTQALSGMGWHVVGVASALAALWVLGTAPMAASPVSGRRILGGTGMS
ncbi:hypothetical protein ACFYNM_03370 [Streptomyces spororaveus]|uniref:hypothetical protein n=1 Tax=Streptomyces spororaveus TaxID=284039 RepID=UPI0036C367A2